MVKIDIYPRCFKSWMADYGFKKMQGKYGVYYTTRLSEKDVKRSLFFSLRLRGIKYRVYDTCWERSSNYRTIFFETQKEPYVCRYCKKELTKQTLVVDHLVPVAKVKRAGLGRCILLWQGIQNVNDTRNLVPSCAKCNKKKAEHLGLWWIRGQFGKYPWFSKVYGFMLCLFYLLLLALCYFLLKNGSYLLNVFFFLLQNTIF